ncbi:hypothetical protein FH972_020287 [Carpinus fangiana]|uniref:Bifunctional inhibitor/plant lipid transfer protein/seed storage helical domain-containing protein n=1 Tax=Carpinus fangiana TaxID=176857 RepID=A0A5N6RT01_9ROSI|nr:hypothetical protein FH972_020287 [Carpinus fangiana]
MGSTSAKVSAILLFIAMIVLLASLDVGDGALIKWKVDQKCYNKYYPSCVDEGEKEDVCQDRVAELCSSIKCVLCNHPNRIKV